MADVCVFTPPDDEIRLPVINATGAVSFALVYKLTNIGIYHGVMGNHDTSNIAICAFEIDFTNILTWVHGGVGGSNGTTTLAAAKWYILGVSRAAGSATPKFHIKNLTDNTAWVHENGSASLGNPATQAGGTQRFGEWQDSDDADGKMACTGEWVGTALSDAQFEALTGGVTNWINHAVTPSRVTRPGYRPGGVVEDHIGSLDSTTISGTTIDSADDPTNFSLELETWPPPGEEDAPETLRVVQSGLQFA